MTKLKSGDSQKEEPKQPAPTPPQEAQKSEGMKEVDTILSDIPENIGGVKNKLDKLDGLILNTKVKMKNIISQTKPNRKKSADKFLSTNKTEQPSSTDKSFMRLELEILKNEIGYAKEAYRILNRKFKNLIWAKKENIKLERLRDRSRSRPYLKKNKKPIAKQIIKALNSAIESDKKENVLKVQTLSLSNLADDKLEFNKEFLNLLKNEDSNIYITISGLDDAKDAFCEFGKDILKKWDSVKDATIPGNLSDSLDIKFNKD